MAERKGIYGLRRRSVRPRQGRWLVNGGMPASTEAAISLGVALIGWEVIARLLSNRVFPPASTVVARINELAQEGILLSEMMRSLTNLAISMPIILIGGIMLGLGMGSVRGVRVSLEPYVNAMLTAPSIAFAPILFSIFGFNRWPVILFIVHSAIFIVIITTAEAVESVRRDVIDMGRIFLADRRQEWFLIMLPAAASGVLSGVRLGVGRAVKAMVLAEMFISVFGLGRIVMDAGRAQDAPTVLAITVVVTCIALALLGLVRLVDSRVTRWMVGVEKG